MAERVQIKAQFCKSGLSTSSYSSSSGSSIPFALMEKVPCASGRQGESRIFAIRQFCLPFLSETLVERESVQGRQSGSS